MTIDAAQRFAALGAELLARAPIAAYRGVDHVALDPITLAQPGFCGIDYRGLTIVGLNPGRGTGDAAARLRRWNDAYMRDGEILGGLATRKRSAIGKATSSDGECGTNGSRRY